MPSLVFDNLFSWTPVSPPTAPVGVADSSPSGFGDALQRASLPPEGTTSSEPAADSDAFSSSAADSAETSGATASESAKRPAAAETDATGESSASTSSTAGNTVSSNSQGTTEPTDTGTSGTESANSSTNASNSTTPDSTSTNPTSGRQPSQPLWQASHRFPISPALGRPAGAPATTASNNSPATGNSGNGKPAPLATVQELASSSTNTEASNSGDAAAALAATVAAATAAAHTPPRKAGTTPAGADGATAASETKAAELASAPTEPAPLSNEAASGSLGELLTAERAALVSANTAQAGKPSHSKATPAADIQPHAVDQAAAGSADSPSAASQQLVADAAANLPAAPSAEARPWGARAHATNDPSHAPPGSAILDLLAASASAAAVALPASTASGDPATSASVSSTEPAAPVTAANNSAQSPLGPATGVGQPTTPNSTATAGSSSGSSNGGTGSSVGDVDRVRFVQRVARAFQAADQEGGQIRLRLSPPELGSVKLQISVQGGSLTAHVETETSSARTLLLDNLPALRERLAGHNIKIEQFDINLMNRSGGDASGSFASGYRDSHQQGGAPAPRGAAPATESPTAAAAVAGSTVSTNSSGAINLLV